MKGTPIAGLGVVTSVLGLAKARAHKAALLILAVACLFVGGAAKAADAPGGALPTDLVSVQLSNAPSTVTMLFSLSHWPLWPPLPPGFASSYPGLDFYLSPGLNALFVDDRQSEAMAAMIAAVEPPPAPGGTNDDGGDPGVPYGPRVDYSTNHTDLYLTILSVSNGLAHLVLHNTSNAVPYEVVSSYSLTNRLTNWTSEGIWPGLHTNTTTNTPADIAIGSRTNQLFFQAHDWRGAFDHGVPTNGQLFVLANTNSIYPVINGTTNPLTPFYGSNWFMLSPPLYCVNMGYDASDNGFTNSLVNTNGQQGVLELLGFSTTLTNLCLSYNPLTNIDVSGWPELQDLECWHCTNLVTAAVARCPKLARTCFEAAPLAGHLDFTGCPEIADIRAASIDNLTDIVFAGGAGPKVWHLCTHDDASLHSPSYSLSQFPLMKQLWVWNDGISQDLHYSTATASNTLEWVEAAANHIKSADFSGQTHLTRVCLSWFAQVSAQELTNLVITGCSAINEVHALDQLLSTPQVDAILTNCDASGTTDGWVELYGNGSASSVGVDAAAHLTTKGWTVEIETESPCGTNTGPIWFVNTTTDIAVKVVAPGATTITWYWGDGSSNSGPSEITNTIAAGSSNAVVVNPPCALLAFGVRGLSDGCNNSGEVKLSAVGGLTNYPNLQELYLYQSGVSEMSLAGCSNLVWLALVGTSNDSALVSQYFIDLNNSHRSTPPAGGEHMGCGSGTAPMCFWPLSCTLTADGTAAKNNLGTNKGWHFWP